MAEPSAHNRWLIMVMLSIIVTIGLWGYLFRPLEVHTCVARGGQIVGLDAPKMSEGRCIAVSPGSG